MSVNLKPHTLYLRSWYCNQLTTTTIILSYTCSHWDTGPVSHPIPTLSSSSCAASNPSPQPPPQLPPSTPAPTLLASRPPTNTSKIQPPTAPSLHQAQQYPPPLATVIITTESLEINSTDVDGLELDCDSIFPDASTVAAYTLSYLTEYTSLVNISSGAARLAWMSCNGVVVPWDGFPLGAPSSSRSTRRAVQRNDHPHNANTVSALSVAPLNASALVVMAQALSPQLTTVTAGGHGMAPPTGFAQQSPPQSSSSTSQASTSGEQTPYCVAYRTAQHQQEL